MNAKAILDILVKEYPLLVFNRFPFPLPYLGSKTIKAILLGADPTHIVNDIPQDLSRVFGLDLNYSPYWNGIKNNINTIESLTLDNLYVQNVCRIFFKIETSKNEKWTEIAQRYWIQFLKEELENLFDPELPILMTTEFILKASLNNPEEFIKASDLYKYCKTFPKETNNFHRELIALYRHPDYSLKLNKNYSTFLSDRFKS